jgi:hypothetical protein
LLQDERGVPIATFERGLPTIVSWQVFEEVTAMVSASFPPPAGRLCLETESDRITARGDFTNEARTVPFARTDSGAPPTPNAARFVTEDWGCVVAPLAIDGAVNAPAAIVTAANAARNLRGRTASSFEFVERCR